MLSLGFLSLQFKYLSLVFKLLLFLSFLITKLYKNFIKENSRLIIIYYSFLVPKKLHNLILEGSIRKCVMQKDLHKCQTNRRQIMAIGASVGISFSLSKVEMGNEPNPNRTNRTRTLSTTEPNRTRTLVVTKPNRTRTLKLL